MQSFLKAEFRGLHEKLCALYVKKLEMGFWSLESRWLEHRRIGHFLRRRTVGRKT